METRNIIFLMLIMISLAKHAHSTNHNHRNGSTSFVFVDSRRPQHCNSPGWEKNPNDIQALTGSFVYYHCKNKFSHNKTLWFLNGRVNIRNSYVSSRVHIYNGGKNLRFGPIMTRDDGIAINCEVYTSFGYLPSPLGVVRVVRRPKYSPKAGSALISKPYYFDFGYTGSDPRTYKWYKNGHEFNGESGRVIVDSHGITFTKILQKDSGLYYVKARNKAGSASGSAYLKVLYWWRNGTRYQHASSSNSNVPLNVAVAIAIDTNSRRLPYNTTATRHLSVSSVDSTVHAFRKMRRLNNRATLLARQQGRSRREMERILRQITSSVGHPLVSLDDETEKKILNASHCRESTMEFNCKHNDVLSYRTINGTCNNLLYPLNGAAHSPFARLLPAEYEDRISQPKGFSQMESGNPFRGPWPSPRFISWRLIKDLETHDSPNMSHMFMSYGQFIDHDLDLIPMFSEEDIECDCNTTLECTPIPVRPEDPVFGVKTSHMGRCIPFSRSIPVCSTNGKQMIQRNQLNQLTSFMDASNVYGSENELAERLRLKIGGLLREGSMTNSKKGNLPFKEEKPPNGNIPFFEAGDERVNEQVGLTVMHTIFMREHNRIAKKLIQLNPCWDDERIYQEARKIVGATLQVITYNEFLPILFGEYYNEYVPKYTKYNPFVDSTIPNAFAAAAFRFGHSLIRPLFMRLNKDYLPVKEGPLPLEKAFFSPIEYFKSNGTDEILRGFLVAPAREVDEFLNNILTSKLFTEGTKKLGVDLASLNIQRGRDHGLAPYRKWQQFCESVFPGKNASFKFPTTKNVMKSVYGNRGFHNGIDLWVGGLAERTLPGAHVGPTFACIIGLTFSKVRDGDRFWYKNSPTFKYYQVRELEKISLSKVLCNNADSISEVQPNAFRSDQARVPCEELDDINLNNWIDSKCRYRRN